MDKTDTADHGELCFYRVDYFAADLQGGSFEYAEGFVGKDKEPTASITKKRSEQDTESKIDLSESESEHLARYYEDEEFVLAISLWEIGCVEEGEGFGNINWCFES